MRFVLAIALLALFAPAATAGAACPGLPEVECSADVDSDYAATAHVGVREFDANVHAQPPQGPGSPIAGAAVERYESDEFGEIVVTAAVSCTHTVRSTCVPATFVGTHVAPEGHDFRLGSDSHNRGGSSSYSGSVAGHHVAYTMGTYYDRELRFGYIGVWIDGQGGEQFGAFPLLV